MGNIPMICWTWGPCWQWTETTEDMFPFRLLYGGTEVRCEMARRAYAGVELGEVAGSHLHMNEDDDTLRHGSIRIITFVLSA